MTVNACVPRQNQDNITTMHAEKYQDTPQAGCNPSGTSIHLEDLRIMTEPNDSPMTVTACVPSRNDSIHMLQDNPDRMLTGVVRNKKRNKQKSPSIWWGSMDVNVPGM